MSQTPRVKDLETALFSGVSNERPRGGKLKKLTWKIILARPRLGDFNIFQHEGKETKDSITGFAVFFLYRFGTE
jgi:hypothetical protein